MGVDDLKRISRTLTTHPIGASFYFSCAVCMLSVQEDDGLADAPRGGCVVMWMWGGVSSCNGYVD